MADVLQGLPLENLFIINVSNLQNVLTQVAAAVRQNAAGIIHHSIHSLIYPTTSSLLFLV
jgi:hypothetical protein